MHVFSGELLIRSPMGPPDHQTWQIFWDDPTHLRGNIRGGEQSTLLATAGANIPLFTMEAKLRWTIFAACLRPWGATNKHKRAHCVSTRKEMAPPVGKG